ncbi:Diaminopimelate epimerase-like protein [Serendipita vermifera]|nr:Diaminopimelate epimerase-like protein [Serendipita vermifera]
MTIQFFHVDAFTLKPFTGNPAAVVFLQEENQFNDDRYLQTVASEFNLPACSFLLPIKPSAETTSSVPRYQIKWFSPLKRIPICGHGTMAASHVVFEINQGAQSIEYDAGPAGPLIATKKDSKIELEFPACKLVDLDQAGDKVKANVDVKQILRSVFPDSVELKHVGRGDRGGYVDLIVAEITEDYPLKEAKLNIDVLTALYPEIRGIIFTTRSSKDPEYHIHSRVVHTEVELGEDQVTGSAHCMLAPYWIEKLGIQGEELKAAQVSQRGGSMNLVYNKEEMRCFIRSTAVTLAKGEIKSR